MSRPQHVAIIMDGNGRWAKARGLTRAQGHAAGAAVLYDIVKAAAKQRINWLTLFAFSSENWRRPQQEVEDLFSLLREFVDKDLLNLHSNNVKLKVIGNRAVLPEDLLEIICKVESLTLNNTGLQLIIAFNYGARDEIVRAVQSICLDVMEGKRDIAKLTASDFSTYLDTAFIPDPDLIIRTGGEIRLSNFLLWQVAYSEFCFLPCFWPDFTEEHFIKALEDYNQRERRYGALCKED